jgi:hypothetical protein
LAPQGRDGRFESLLIAFRAAALWRPVRARLAKGQFTAQNGPSGVAERACECDQERRVAVRSGAMGEDEGIAGRIGREMKEAAHRRFIRRRFQKFVNIAHIGQTCVSRSE